MPWKSRSRRSGGRGNTSRAMSRLYETSRGESASPSASPPWFSRVFRVFPRAPRRGITLALLRDACLGLGRAITPLGGQSGTPGGDGARRPREEIDLRRGCEEKARSLFFPGNSADRKHSRGRRAAVRFR